MSLPGYRKSGFANGLRWLPTAAERLFANFGPLAGVAALWLLVSMISVVPLIGQVVVILITPLLTAGAIAAFHATAQGEKPSPTILFYAWPKRRLRNALLAVGLFWLGGTLAALAIVATWLQGQVSLEQLQSAGNSPEAMNALLQSLAPGPELLLALLVFTVALAAMYFAIPLLLFSTTRVTASLWLSLRAVIANWAAFLGFGLVAIAAFVALGVIFGILALVLGLAMGAAGQMIGQIGMLIVTMLVQLLMAGTQWVAYGDVFGLPRNRNDAPDDQDQLLA
jgi:hypothetical protein